MSRECMIKDFILNFMYTNVFIDFFSKTNLYCISRNNNQFLAENIPYVKKIKNYVHLYDS